MAAELPKVFSYLSGTKKRSTRYRLCQDERPKLDSVEIYLLQNVTVWVIAQEILSVNYLSLILTIYYFKIAGWHLCQESSYNVCWQNTRHDATDQPLRLVGLLMQINWGFHLLAMRQYSYVFKKRETLNLFLGTLEP